MKIAPLKISLFIIITVSISMIICGMLFYKNLIGFLGAWNQSNKMNIYLKVDATDADKKAVVDSIKSNSFVASVNIVDRKEAGETFQKSLKEFSTGLVTSDEMIDLIPETIEVDLINSLGLKEREAEFGSLAKQLNKFEQIEEINYSASWLRKFELIDRAVRSLGIFVFLIFLLTVSYLVKLMVRVYIDDSKQEIEIYSLLGATRWSIYKLFLADIFIFLTSSLMSSFTILAFLFFYLKNRLATSGIAAIISENLRFLSFSESMFVVLAIFVFVYLNSFLTIQTSVNKLNQLTND